MVGFSNTIICKVLYDHLGMAKSQRNMSAETAHAYAKQEARCVGSSALAELRYSESPIVQLKLGSE